MVELFIKQAITLVSKADEVIRTLNLPCSLLITKLTEQMWFRVIDVNVVMSADPILINLVSFFN